MRFSTFVDSNCSPPKSARQWNIPDFSIATSPVGDSEGASIPVWKKEHIAERDAGNPEGFRLEVTPQTHSKSMKQELFPAEAARPIPEVWLPCHRGFRNPTDANPRRNRLLRGSHRKSLSQKLFGLVMALCIAVGLLGCIMDRLSGELNLIESELERRNEMMSGRDHDASTSPHSSSNSSRRRTRRLATTGSEALNERHSTTHTHHGFLHNMKFQIVTIVRLVKFLNQGGEYGTTAALVKTLHKLSESSILTTATGNANSMSQALAVEDNTSSSFKLDSVQSGQALFHTDLQRTAISLRPLQKEFVPSTRSHHIPKAAWTGSIFSKTVSGNPTSYNLFSSTTGDIHSEQNEADIPVVPVQHSRGNTPRTNPIQIPMIYSRNQPIPFPTEALDQQRTEANVAGTPNSIPKPNHPVEGFVLWDLPRGRSLCRVFNVARLSDGTLFLPKWMEKHKETLEAQCGLKNTGYVFDKNSKDQVQKDYSSGKTLLDETFAHRDLFCPHTPRHHMPHFLSDIIPPLVATEVLLGSGREVVPFKCISAEGTGSDSFPSNVVYDVKPFLFLDMETVAKPPTHWVPSLARFFSHPNIGFELVPDLMSDRSSQPKGLNRLTLLRSVMLTNVNPYEPYGLFGADGKNHVFSYNGISREPTWTSTGMLKRPCVVSITVLTRKGHRALLELEKLQTAIKARFLEQGLDLDFKIVDFQDMCFEDQVRIMQSTNVLIASHGAGNTNLVFMRPGGTVIEVFPFSYKAGPFDGFAKVFGMEYKTAMSAPETEVFKGCMRRKEKNAAIMKEVFHKWDKAVEEDKTIPWVHRLDFEKEFGEPGKSEGMTTRICARQQQLKFNIHAVAQMALDSGLGQCHFSQAILDQKSVPFPHKSGRDS